MKRGISVILLVLIFAGCQQEAAVKEKETVQTYEMTTEIPTGILTPDKVETSIGSLEYFDGVPSKETSENVYDYLDRMRGVDAFMKGIPGASVRGLILGLEEVGVDDYNKVGITKTLLDSKSLLLTANTSTIYVTPYINVGKSGPIVMETPPGMLGAFNDAWFRYIADIGPFGEDKGKGGNYLILPPGYEGEVPEGYFVIQSPTNRVFVFTRTSIANGIDKAVKMIGENLKIYPLTEKDNAKKMELVDISGVDFNTVHTNDFSFYEHLAEWINEEYVDMLDNQTKGLFASIGIEKGKPFAPDERMKKILTEAVAIGNAAARSITYYPRTAMNLEGVEIYPDTESSWIMAFADKNVFFTTETGGYNTDALDMFHYNYTAVTPAMAVTMEGAGSDYAIAFLDGDKNPFDGAKEYKLHIPADVPVNDFWAVTIYDTQTRSLLQTDQQFPTVGSLTEGFKQNEDGSFDVFFSPNPGPGQENNWLQTIPGKSFIVILRVYGPLKPWIDKTWRPGEVELVK
ncbi:DUF1254 domain-containing protein [Robiginitalea aurantiaca]|uniref:DUF1254 domain-containing protein n=1 Tax=Robiginitalea aurantiaca TaxID=3056915 RepID=A0ABT7WDK7_9FLAO|nr:DUF1254 domain-containing protein [Robiginitalea aurantiaca]MDM9630997.1 DUF1254 domain-containing protein [Robiginitalea aurantiaca]